MTKTKEKQKETLRRSRAMRKSWAIRRQRMLAEAEFENREINNIPDPFPRPSKEEAEKELAVWKDIPIEKQLENYQVECKMLEDNNRKLRQKLEQVQVLANAVQSIMNSIQNLDRMTP
jgi:hypothetical protein